MIAVTNQIKAAISDFLTTSYGSNKYLPLEFFTADKVEDDEPFTRTAYKYGLRIEEVEYLEDFELNDERNTIEVTYKMAITADIRMLRDSDSNYNLKMLESQERIRNIYNKLYDSFRVYDLDDPESKILKGDDSIIITEASFKALLHLTK